MKSQKQTKYVSLKIKTLNSSIYQIFVNPNQPISAVQGQIQQKTHVPIQAQRLLFRGVNLQTKHTFNHYNILQNSILSLIANKIPSQFSQNSSIKKSQANKIKNINKQHMKFKKHMNYQQRTTGFRIPKLQSLQVLEQNKNTLNQLLQCVNFNYSQDNTPFKLQRRKIKIGQWVDVRDMSGQWAQAQIIAAYNQYVKIHYNGWPQRMNQWIPQNSQRIMPFRSHTVQSGDSNYLSPSPKYQTLIKSKQNTHFQPDIQKFITQLPSTIQSFTKLLKQLEMQQKYPQQYEQIIENQNLEAQNDNQNQNEQSVKNMSNNAQNAENIQNNMKDIDEVQFDKKQQFYTPSKQIRANDNLSNKAQDDVSKCDKSDISNKSNKSIKSKRSQGLVDTQSMKSLIIDDKKRVNKIFFDNSEAQSVKSVKNQNHVKYNYFGNQEYIIEESDSQINDRQDVHQNFITFRKKQYKRKMKSSQLAPLCDRIGRLLIDLAPHFAILGYQEQSYNNFNQCLSTFTNQGSLQSKMAKAQQIIIDQQRKINQIYPEQSKYCQFQIPVMLTPVQINTLSRLLQDQKKKLNLQD